MSVLLAASVFQNGKNKKLGHEALDKARTLKKERVSLKANEKEIIELNHLTVQNCNGLNHLFSDIEPKLETYDWDMRQIKQDVVLLEHIGILINTLRSAAELLNKKVGDTV